MALHDLSWNSNRWIQADPFANGFPDPTQGSKPANGSPMGMPPGGLSNGTIPQALGGLRDLIHPIASNDIQQAHQLISSGQAFAGGGDPPLGLASLVGENGPELIVPKSPVTIIPNPMRGVGLQPPQSGPTPGMGGDMAAPSFPILKPLVSTPRQQLEQNLQAQISKFNTPANPKGFWQNLGHVMAQTGAWQNSGTEVARREQEDSRVKQLAGLQGQDLAEQNAASENELRSAQASEAPARVRMENAQADEAENKINQGPDLAQAYAHAVNQAIKNNVDPATDPIVQHLGDAITAIQKEPLPKGMEHVDLTGPGGKPVGANYDPTKGVYTDATGKVIQNPVPYEKPNQAGMITMIAPDPNNPGGGIVQRLGEGAHIAPGSQTAAGVNSMNTPTTNQRTAAGRAETVLAMVPEVTSRIDATASQMGPEMGRWNDFMQGKIGTDNPQFAALRSDLLMMSSAVALAHAQGRLPENLREEFDKAINAPKQTPENLKATIQAMVPWLQQVQSQGEHANGTQPQVGVPKDGDVKTNGAGDKIKFSGGKWVPE